ncbi:hypothetical protein CLV78_1268 [Aliiruegeria haliotis]|uniref:Uncharacterized protein n=1 Tax=Aliiruegeria haliotis TaxID=1280846 RepID=A0A2T0RDH6_9RHOB|nr:hypothetical protein [Aliiruegeria haliotis]PRY19236.1 hypothetical protein CLV78_1268 [Aliiruegeria haliotis]
MNVEHSTVDGVPSIAGFLSESQWKHALFTTYALSLSYFESEVLRPLIGQGCDDIWLVSDAQGYRSSLLERRSMRVGQEYRIVPVGLPHGVFHPKCIYLCSDDEHLLLVGSGNVTFGGHGRNTEVFEALVPEQHATAFSDFADFLIALGSSPDVKIAKRDWIDDFAERAIQAANGGGDADYNPVRLIHPLEQTAVEQISTIANPLGPCREARVLSPYHDPDGLAVRTLLDVVEAGNGVIAVTSENSSPFPFAVTGTWARSVVAKKPTIDLTRFVHAKWIELEFEEETILLTGSFNATRKALTTTDNVELGVLRHLARDDETLGWSTCDVPEFEPAHRLPSGLGNTEIVHASFDRHDVGHLKGQVLSLQTVTGDWSYRVVQADGGSYSDLVTLDEEGAFEIKDPGLEAFSEMPALQIVLNREDREARGWIHNEMLLSVGSRRRLTAGAMSRLMRREGSDDDIQALLDYLSVAADKHLRVFDLTVSRQAGHLKDPSDANTQVVRVDLDDLAPLHELPDNLAAMPGIAASSGDQFETALVRLRRMLLGHGSYRNVPSQAAQSTAHLAEDETEAIEPPDTDQDAYRLGLTDFEQAISDMIDDCADHPDNLPGLLTMQFEIGMWMRIHRLGDPDGAYEFLGNWLRRTSHLTTVYLDQVTSLSQHFVTGVAVRAALAKEDYDPQFLVSLHDDLEKFFGGPVDNVVAIQSLIEDSDSGFAAALSPKGAEIELRPALTKVLATPTRRQQLEEALTLRDNGENVPDTWEVFQSASGKKLHQSMHRDGWQRRVKATVPDYHGCIFCFAKFPVQELSVFHRERIGHCVQCRKFTLDLNP